MSAIAGIYYLDDRPVDRADLGRMIDILAHRGPDGADIWCEGTVGLGHRMLWTTPESLLEQLPLVNQTGELVITADARIDNRDELVAALDLNDRPAEKITDSQLILAAYEKWGDRCPEHLLGDFAFAIWDARKQVLFCARDPMGVKHFYYFHSSKVFVFASEIKALLCLPRVPRCLNELKVAYYLTRNFKDKAITFYQDILRLPAAHSMTVDCKEMRLRTYWSLEPLREVRLSLDEEYVEAFREVFTEAVRCRLRSAFPVRSTLSGGLDSSSIACTARQLLLQEGRGHLHTFSAIFPSLAEEDLLKIDERCYIDAVVGIGGFEPHYIHADRPSPLTDLDRILWHEDEAVLAPNLYMYWAFYKAAHWQGICVLLDGLDGDTTVSHGIKYLTELARTGRWKKLVTEATALARKSPSYSSRRMIWEYGVKPLVPAPVMQYWRVLRGCNQPLQSANTVINPVFAQRIGLAERSQTLLGDDAFTPSVPIARKSHWHGLTSSLIPHALELADKATAASSLEARYPFFDRRLVEFCLALPPEQKLHQGWTRAIMHRAMVGILPPLVQSRFTKGNLSPNFKRRLLEYERGTLEEVVLNQPHIIKEYIDVSALKATYQRYVSQPMQGDATTVYSAVILARWLHQSGLTA